jgi:hypothetical protein
MLQILLHQSYEETQFQIRREIKDTPKTNFYFYKKK